MLANHFKIAMFTRMAAVAESLLYLDEAQRLNEKLIEDGSMYRWVTGWEELLRFEEESKKEALCLERWKCLPVGYSAIKP